MFGDWWLTARASIALVLANARYWTTVAPAARTQLERWQRKAEAIPDPHLRAVALEKLHGERFNAEGTTTLATLARRSRRARVAEAIVALQVMYDYLDGLAEQPTFHSTSSRNRLFRAFDDAVTPGSQDRDYYHDRPQNADGGYLRELVLTVRDTIGSLAASAAITPQARQAAQRCARAQSIVHTREPSATQQIRAWAHREAAGTALNSREFLAGAVTSAISIYALIAAGENRRTTQTQASSIDATYLSIGALSTMLDSLIDYEHDLNSDRQWFLPLYLDRAQLANELAETARLAVAQARTLPHCAHHVMTLVGVAAYYLSTPEANREPARSLTRRLDQDLQPLITPTLALMRAWRTARRLRQHTRKQNAPR